MANMTAGSAGTTSWVALVDHLDTLVRSQPVYPCFLLVHPHIAVLRTTAQRLVAHYGWSTVSLGTFLSEALLDVAPQRRPHEVRPLLNRALRQALPGPVVCTDIDLLFEPSLSLDPLWLLRECSRRTPLVVMWPGQFENGVLSYAVPAHGHYRIWPRPDLCDGCILQL